MAAGDNLTQCLTTIVRNTSGVTKTFGFLPPHGVTLLPGEEFNIFGDLSLALTRGNRRNGHRNLAAFEKALQDGDLALEQTPSPILRDANHVPHAMAVSTGGVLSSATPCWVAPQASDSLGAAN